MFAIISDDIRALLQEVTPWIVGSEGADKNFAPIFKENTPSEIREKHKMLSDLVKVN